MAWSRMPANAWAKLIRAISGVCCEESNKVSMLTLRFRRSAVAAAAALVLAFPAGISWAARPAPEGFADLTEKLVPAVVNISTTQTVKPDKQRERAAPGRPQFPPGSPFEEFFKDFFDRNGQHSDRPEAKPRKATSLGSGFVIDPAGYIVTNNHVIADADEITVLKVKTDKKLPAVIWGDSDKARVGDWVLAVGNPFGLGGSVTAGILSARQRDINSGPYD